MVVTNDDNMVIILTLLSLFLITFITSAVLYSQLIDVRREYLKFKLDQNAMMCLYINVARDYRDLVSRFNKLKSALAQSFFKDQNLIDVMNWYNKYQIQEGWGTDGFSKKDIVDKNTQIIKNETSNYDKLIR